MSEQSQSIDFFGKTLHINPEVLSCYNAAVQSYEAGDFVRAAMAFSEAIKLSPDNGLLYTYRGTSYEDAQNFVEAKKDFEKALELEPENALAAYRLGMIYSDNNDLVNASKWLLHSYNNHRFDLPYVRHMGWTKNCLFFVGKHIVANNVAFQYMRANLPHAAIPYLEHAIKIDFEYANAYYGLGLAKNSLGLHKEAVALLTHASLLGHKPAAAILKDLKM